LNRQRDQLYTKRTESQQHLLDGKRYF